MSLGVQCPLRQPDDPMSSAHVLPRTFVAWMHDIYQTTNEKTYIIGNQQIVKLWLINRANIVTVCENIMYLKP